MSVIYHPQKYKLEDLPMQNFIDSEEIWEILKRNENPSPERVREVIARSLDKHRLSLEETAVLINANTLDLIEEIKNGARELKERVYGKRIVLFAPLYIGNLCINNCAYCGFRTDNKKQKRITLSSEEIKAEVEMLEDSGHKRLILVYGEHPKYDADFIAETVRNVYSVKKGNGEIRRVNINAAPMDIEGFKVVKDAGIGTYQVFQETYDRNAYLKVHLGGKKRDYDWRITALDRAQEAGIDDVGIGALLGLYDWRFEVLGLLRHVNHFEAVYNVGPHTISFPRLKQASGFDVKPEFEVSDEEFTRLVAILRLAVPYTGLILTAREPAHIRDEVLQFGVSQIDGGTNIEMKGYSSRKDQQDLDHEQFTIGDNRTLNEVMEELLGHGYLPSFCTACYRLKRTGEHFMEFSVPGFIKRFCQPNAMLTMAEYLEDYAPAETREKGYKLIAENLKEYKDDQFREKLIDRLERVKKGERDLYF
ncbi:iron-only hydrogenase maturation protein HydG [Marinilabilia salmonicolor]|uniref:[FeFe] hydrogenase H-cluster radical SAM maturase HydG n=1 Tax=Marinilabilia salmonicolor TaxID=989 RepID=UPI000D081814|nr:[FeFe] hydrogenase H-cluster radical SAM maturase HydG [Marinilabilia salmonicolor]PRY96150.1 iron-only hydrogenase maturation protein HydG [Marinilabilia salmonicolor]